MPSVRDFPAHGKVVEVADGRVFFRPSATNYQLRLNTSDRKYAGPLNQPIECIIRLVARKIWTVTSGGLFISPIFGEPRIVQGRVLLVDDRMIVVHAGTSIAIDLPGAQSAFDLAAGPIEAGAMVNVTALPGAAFERLEPAIDAQTVQASKS